MSNHEILTDDYVAGLLAKEADDCSLKYSGMGMEAFRSDKKPANMPKPNTRFLRHIIRDTNTHNKNLLAKEAAESQARLKTLERTEEKERRKRAGPQDIRKRQMGDIKAILGGRTEKLKRSGEKSDKKDDAPPRSRHHRDRRSESPERRRHHRSRRDDSDSERDDRRRHKSDRRRSRSQEDSSRRHRHRSPLGAKDLMSRSRSERAREEDGEDLTSRSSRARRERDGLSIKGSSSRRAEEAKSPAAASDSDPLDDIIGPAPPPAVRSRGRGAVSNGSGIDKRFEADYDPKMDVEMEDGAGAGEDWDDAVEAFRDRQKWQQHQEQRMRAAGFGEDELKKWRNGDQKDEQDVRWTKAGEKREWDRGKEGLSGLFSEFN
ncbi:hypothetical protein CSOJ01_05422 [Colletotrichum sojae]|uniref:Pre-mRNA-splicing factor 38B n=1 Tax=Colletotrichum sojae TaxID=2175907 RepID=A0A8H6MWU5_9PEZI|nr:hypothetical protein CSOJ01_05422 [Colletotrichum sojae]